MYDHEQSPTAQTATSDRTGDALDPQGAAAAGQSAELQPAWYPLEPATRSGLQAVIDERASTRKTAFDSAQSQAEAIATALSEPAPGYARFAAQLISTVEGVDDWIANADDLLAAADDEQADDPADLRLVDSAAGATQTMADDLSAALPGWATQIVVPGTSIDELPNAETLWARIKAGEPIDTAPTLSELATAETAVAEAAVGIRMVGARLVDASAGKAETVTALAEPHQDAELHYRQFLLGHLIGSGAHLEVINQVADAWSLSTADFSDQLAALYDWKTGVAVEDVPPDHQAPFLWAIGNVGRNLLKRQQAQNFDYAVFGEAYAGMCRAVNVHRDGSVTDPDAPARAATAELEWREARAVIVDTVADYRGEEGARQDLVDFAEDGLARIDTHVASFVGTVDMDMLTGEGVVIDNAVADKKALAELKGASKAFVSCADSLNAQFDDYAEKRFDQVVEVGGGSIGKLIKYGKDVLSAKSAIDAAAKARQAGLTDDDVDAAHWKVLTAVGGLMKDGMGEILEFGIDQMLAASKTAASAAAARGAQHLLAQYQGALDVLNRGAGTLLALPAVFFAVKKLVNLPEDAGEQAKLDAIMGVVGSSATAAATAAGIGTVGPGIAVASVHLTLTIMGQLGGMLERIKNDALAEDVEHLVETARKASKAMASAHGAQAKIHQHLGQKEHGGFDAALYRRYAKRYRDQVEIATVQTMSIGTDLGRWHLRTTGAALAFKAHQHLVGLKAPEDEGWADLPLKEIFSRGKDLGQIQVDVFKGVKRVTERAAKRMTGM